MSPPGSMRAMTAAPLLHKEPLTFEYVQAVATQLQVMGTREQNHMRLKLRIWRQKNAQSEGKLVDYDLDDVSEDSLVPRDARFAQRAVDHEGRGAGRL